jgi:hypothetical protein
VANDQSVLNRSLTPPAVHSRDTAHTQALYRRCSPAVPQARRDPSTHATLAAAFAARYEAPSPLSRPRPQLLHHGPY